MEYYFFGSGFNPPHNGHTKVLKTIEDSIIYISAARGHAFGKNMIDYSHRKRMAQLWIEDEFPDGNVIYSDVEESINKEIIYSIDVLEEFKKRNENVILLLGPDNQQDFHKFHRYNEIETTYKVRFIEESFGIRSTLCRKVIENKKFDDLSKMVCRRVFEYIMDNYLYGD